MAFRALRSHRLVLRLKSLLQIFNETEFVLLVSSLSFSTAFYIIPTFALMLAVSQFMGGLGLVMEAFKPELLEFAGFNNEFVGQISKSLESFHFSSLGIGGFLGMLFAATQLVNDIDAAVQRIWGEADAKFQFRRILLFWVILFLFPLGVSIFIGTFSYEIFSHLGLYPRDSLPLLALFAALFLLNKYAPRTEVSVKEAAITALIASLALWLLKEGFFWANGVLFDYGNLYGSLAFLPLLLLWIRLTWQVVLGSVMLCRLLHSHFNSDSNH